MPYSYKQGQYVHDFPALRTSGSDIVLTHAAQKSDAIMADIERNMMTYAPSRSGKGVTQIIPNLLHWSHNALVIDPKGEAAEATTEAREAMGQAVYVLDPFETCNIADRFRARLNLLDEIDPNSPHAFRQINALSDGIIMRHSQEAGHWDGGAQQVLSGFIAHAISKPDFNNRSLVGMRDLLQEPDPELFHEIVQEMSANTSCGKLPIAAAGKLTKTGTEAGHFLSGATSNTEWIDDPFMRSFLSESTFKLSDLKRKPMTVYLVLPFDALENYGRFLRLFVRMGLHHMMQKMPNGSLKGERCLFILDEFFSLGHIAEIQKAVGGLPGFNLHLWAFLQDWNQMLDLYGDKGAGTFTSNSDIDFYFGVDDPATAERVATSAGRITEHDLQISPPDRPADDEAPEQYEGLLGAILGIETYEYSQWAKGRVMPVQSTPTPQTEHVTVQRVKEEDEDRDTPRTENREQVDQVATTRQNFDSAKKYEQDMREFNSARATVENKRAQSEAQYANAMNLYHHAQQTIGHNRLSQEQIYKITAKNSQRNICDHALMMMAGDCYKIDLVGYFEETYVSPQVAANDPFLPNIKGLEDVTPEGLDYLFQQANPDTYVPPVRASSKKTRLH